MTKPSRKDTENPMREHDEASGPWREVLEEVQRLRADALRRDEELWEAVEAIHEKLAEQRNGSPPSPANEDGDGRRLDPSAYRLLKRRLRRLVATALPEGGRVAVVSRGDQELLDLPGCETEHYPRLPGGGWLGFYPRDGLSAVAHLEWVRAEGAAYLLLPDTARWWMDEFPDLAAHLAATSVEVASEEGVGILLGLQAGGADREAVGLGLTGILDAWEARDGSAPSLLDWGTGLELGERLPGRSVFSPVRPEPPLPYLDGSVDVVVVRDGSPAVVEEARRVARRTVVRVGVSGGGRNGTRRSGAGSVVEHVGEAPPALPPASIVVPTYDGIAHLEPCLRALDRTLPADFQGEVIVVDDASGPATASALGRLEGEHPWLRIVRNPTNSGFIDSCNRGADEARGDVLVFLNDDTVPLEGWLQALLRTFRTHPDAGAVGGRLVYPDGRLQEAGGVIYRDGSGANFGRDDYAVDAPLYAHVRRVDYCSGALLATPRALFLELGGFDPRYRPAYFEDTDYCFSVRRAGREVYYQPEAIVVHVEGASSGTDLERGVKRYQVRNRGIFREKWQDVLRDLPAAPGAYTARTWHRLAFHGDPR